jgi:two-component system chemotaxis response regulator CheB
VALVQNPDDALSPSMPRSALRYVTVDAVLALAEIGPALVRLVYAPPEAGAAPDGAQALGGVPNVAGDLPPPEASTVALTCPDCGGVMAESYDGDLLRFHCPVGHSYSRESLVEQQSRALDYTLWSAYNALSERVMLAQRLMDDAELLGDKAGRRRFEALATQAQSQRDQISRAFTAGQGLDAPGEG